MSDTIAMEPRTVTRLDGSKRTEIKGVVPTPFGPCRADQIWQNNEGANFPYHAAKDGEIAYILAVWDRMPSDSCFMDAFSKIARGLVK